MNTNNMPTYAELVEIVRLQRAALVTFTGGDKYSKERRAKVIIRTDAALDQINAELSKELAAA